MRPVFLSFLLLVLSVASASAQGWGWSDDDDAPRYRRNYNGSYSRAAPWDDDDGPRRAPRYNPWSSPWNDPYDSRSNRVESDEVLDGGARPTIAPIAPETVPFPSNYAVGTIIIETKGRQLFLVKSDHEAYRYPISVGRVGFTWTGTEKISRIADWPDWYPPQEMRERDSRLPVKMTGGLRNPLGARALYLGNTLYRIHGTNDAKTIGLAASSGCFRMLNGHVMDLSQRVSVGTPVMVIDHLPPEVARAVPPPSRVRAQPTEQARARR